MYKVKKIISLFLKKEPEEINSCTYIDYRGIRSSIMLHRMYSALRAEGINIRETSKIQTFGDLMSHINSGDDPINFHKEKNISLTPISSLPSSQIKIGSSPFNVGIDIESIDQFPPYDILNPDQFYLDNFSLSELNYCNTKINPIESLAARFCLKEAMVKADNSLKRVPFSRLEIIKNVDGSLGYDCFELSISHSTNTVIGIAIKLKDKGLSLSVKNIFKIYLLMLFLTFLIFGLFLFLLKSGFIQYIKI